MFDVCGYLFAKEAVEIIARVVGVVVLLMLMGVLLLLLRDKRIRMVGNLRVVRMVHDRSAVAGTI